MTPEHHWTVLSRHATSEGTVVYESCHCGAQRVRQVSPETRSAMSSRPLAEVRHRAAPLTGRCGR